MNKYNIRGIVPPMAGGLNPHYLVNRLAFGSNNLLNYKIGDTLVRRMYQGDYIVFDNTVVETVYTFTCSEPVKTINATTTTVAFYIKTYKQTYHNGVTQNDTLRVDFSGWGETNDWIADASSSSESDAYYITYTCAENKTESAREKTYTYKQSESNRTLNITLKLNAGSKSYSDITITISDGLYGTMPAKGGSLTPNSNKITYSLTWGWNASTTNGGTLTSGGTVTYAKASGSGTVESNGKVTGDSLGTTLKDQSTLCTVNVTVAMNGKSATKSVNVIQEANTRKLTQITTGQTSDIVVDASGKYISGADSSEDKKIVYLCSQFLYTYTSTATKWEPVEAITVKTDSSWIKPQEGNSDFTVDSRGTTTGNERSGLIWFEKDGVVSNKAKVVQQANVKTYAYLMINWSNNGSTSERTFIAAGAKDSDTVNVSVYKHYSYSSGSTSQEEHDDTTLICSESWFRSTTSSNLIIDSMGATEMGERSGTCYASVDGKDSNNKLVVKQSANTVTYGNINLNVTSNPSDIPASGGTSNQLTYIVSQRKEFASGASADCKVTVNQYTVTGKSLGTTFKDRTKLGEAQVIANGEGGKQAIVVKDVYQAKNVITKLNPVSCVVSYPTVAPNGGNTNYSLSNTDTSCTFSSGSVTSEMNEAGLRKFIGSNGTLIQIRTFTIASTKNGFNLANTENGQLSVSSMGTTLGNRTSDTITKVVKRSITGKGFQPNVSEISQSATTTCTQGENKVSYSDVTVNTSNPSTISHNGGSVNVASNVSYTQTATYTSGSTVTITNGASVSYTLKTANGATLSGSTVTFPANTSNARSAVVTVSVSLNGKSASKDITVTQEGGVKTYSDITISTFSYNQIGANGGTASPNLSYSQTWGWNGNTTNGGTITSGASVSYSGTNVNTSNGQVSVPSKGTSTSGVTTYTTATVNISLNGKSASKQATVTQAANSATYSELSGGSANGAQIPASGGSVRATVGSKPTQTVSFTSGASRAGNVTVGTFSEVSAASKGTTESGVTTVGTSSATCTGEGSKTKTISASITQAANSKSETTNWNAWSVKCTANPTNIAATGGTSTISSSASRSGTIVTSYTSGSKTERGTSENGSTTLSISGDGFTLNGTTVTASKNEGGSRSCTVTAKCNQDNSKTATATITQSSGQTITSYGNITISGGSVGIIPASGGSVTPSGCTATQAVTYANGNTGTVNVTSSIKYTSVTAGSKGTTVSGETTAGTAKATCSANGKSAEKSFTVKQAANTVVSTNDEVTFDAFTLSADNTNLPASGGTTNISSDVYKHSKTVTKYTSGATSTSASKDTLVKCTLTISGSGFTLSGKQVTAASNLGSVSYVFSTNTKQTTTTLTEGPEAAKTVTVTSKKNTSQTSSRSCTVTAHWEEGYASEGEVRSIVINQQGSNGQSIDQPWSVKSSDSNVTVTKNSQTQLTVKGKAVYGNKNQTLTCKYVINQSEFNKDINLTHVIYLYYLDVSPTSLEFTAKGGTKQVTIDSNCSWTVS